MNRDVLIDRLIAHESLRLHPYTDTAGKITIGVGRNLTDVGITEAEAMHLLNNNISNAIIDLSRNCPWWSNLDESRQLVIVELCFAMGWPKLAGFTKMLAALQRNDFQKAAQELSSSQWARQVGQRAVTLATQLYPGTLIA